MRYIRPGLVAFVLVAALSLPANAGFATAFTVNSVGDGGDSNTLDGICDDGTGRCTLRAAIQQANASAGADTIGFNLPGPGPYSIAPASPLPAVSDTLTTDGTTQPGFVGMPIVELRGDAAGANADGLLLSSLNNVVKGLIVNRFSGNGIDIKGNTATGNALYGNFIGTDRTGTVSIGNSGSGVIVASNNNTIGGASPTERNIISGNGFFGLQIASSTGNVVRGNFIGTDKTGTTQLSNATGLFIGSAGGNTVGGTGAGEGNLISGNRSDGIRFQGLGSANFVQGNLIGTDVTGTRDLGNALSGIQCFIAPGNIIGGSQPAARNVISGNDAAGITLDSAGCDHYQIQGNYIGTDVTGGEPLGNSGDGVLTLLSDTLIGGTGSGEANVIAYNGRHGVAIGGSAVRNTVRSNSIFANAGLGIDLGLDGVTPNDPGDPDSGANNLQNYPVIGAAGTSGGSTTISGSLNSSPAATFQLDFFANTQCDPSLFGEGERFLGATTVVTNSSGDASFTVTFAGVDLDADHDGVKEAVTATVTDASGNTSEFSRCLGSGDNCPAWANPAQNLPPWPVPPNDPDCDGFSTRVENPVGTNPLAHCGTNAWPADINNDGFSDISDISLVGGFFGKPVGPSPNAPARYDVAPDPPDGFVDISDIVKIGGFFGKSCTP